MINKRNGKGVKMKKNTSKDSAEKLEVESEKRFGRFRSSHKGEAEPVTAKIGDSVQSERREAYVEPLTREFLRSLLELGEKCEILPTYRPGLGFLYRAEGLPEKGGNHRCSREFLDNLVKLDILERSFCDSISTCPNCESFVITLHHRCPKCKSHHVVKTSLTEHIPCGYIDQRDRYEGDLCPKCGKSLVEGEYRNMGRWYVCQECNERFEEPQFDVVCRGCNSHFTIDEVRVLDIPKFKLNPKRLKEIRQNVASLESISKLLADLGFRIEMPGMITGHKSGMNYQFSLLAKKQVGDREVVVAVDHEVAEDEIQAPPLILYIYKISEMKVDIPVFIALPKLSETAGKIAKGHEILVIEGASDGGERLSEIKEEIRSRLDKMTAAVHVKPAADVGLVMEKPGAAKVVKEPVRKSKRKRTKGPLPGVLEKLKEKKEADIPSAVHPGSVSSRLRNVIFLLDGSSSMKEGKGSLNNFELVSKAVEMVLTSPDPAEKDDVLSVVVFWNEFLRGFQKDILYDSVSLGRYVDPEKLRQFGEPKRNVGTPLWDAVEYATDFLQGKTGEKIVKLVTDAVDIPRLKDDSKVSKLEKNSIQLDCIVVGSKGNSALGKIVGGYKRSRFFESATVDSLVTALRA
jgi:ssDNA-binding Zn-finger/Zn-ribbon topoisomerase 1